MKSPQVMPSQQRSPVLRTVTAVLWSFVGLRSRQASEKDALQLSPFHVIAAGLVLLVLFVRALVALVHWAVQQPTGF